MLPVSLSVAILAATAGLWLYNQPSRAADAPVVATTCRGFAGDAPQLLANGDIAGTFAAGDRVHLVIYFTGAGHAWEATGVLAMANTAKVTGAGTFNSSTWSASMNPVTNINTETTSNTLSFGLTVEHRVPKATFEDTSHRVAKSHGTISGLAKLEMDIDVMMAGAGSIKISTTGGAALRISPMLASASCSAPAMAPAV